MPRCAATTAASIIGNHFDEYDIDSNMGREHASYEVPHIGGGRLSNNTELTQYLGVGVYE